MDKVIHVLYYPKCGTCKKALKWLDEKGVAYEKANIVEVPPTREELHEWFAQSGLPIKRLFNTSGKSYRALSMKSRFEEGIGEDECLDLLAQDPMLVKRPIVSAEGICLFGFKVDEWEQALLRPEEA